MIIKIGGRPYSVRWKHWKEGEVAPERVTSCLIEPVDVRHSVDKYALGIAVCSKKDNFCKETGRKVSLGRALKSLPRSMRAEVWRQYFQRGM